MLGSAFTKVTGLTFAYTLLLQDLLRELSEPGARAAAPTELGPSAQRNDPLAPVPSAGGRVVPISTARRTQALTR